MRIYDKISQRNSTMKSAGRGTQPCAATEHPGIAKHNRVGLLDSCLWDTSRGSLSLGFRKMDIMHFEKKSAQDTCASDYGARNSPSRNVDISNGHDTEYDVNRESQGRSPHSPRSGCGQNENIFPNETPNSRSNMLSRAVASPSQRCT